MSDSPNPVPSEFVKMNFDGIEWTDWDWVKRKQKETPLQYKEGESPGYIKTFGKKKLEFKKV